MSAFKSPLLYGPSERAGHFDLTSALIYCSDLMCTCVEVPAGFSTNFVTGRKLLVVRRIVQDKMNRAAVIHDRLYERGEVSRALADEVFYEALLVCGVARWRAWSAWSAVRLFGGKFYNADGGAK